VWSWEFDNPANPRALYVKLSKIGTIMMVK